MPKAFNILPKWLIFAKSGHTEIKVHIDPSDKLLRYVLGILQVNVEKQDCFQQVGQFKSSSTSTKELRPTALQPTQNCNFYIRSGDEIRLKFQQFYYADNIAVLQMVYNQHKILMLQQHVYYASMLNDFTK